MSGSAEKVRSAYHAEISRAEGLTLPISKRAPQDDIYGTLSVILNVPV
jgi:hypothetical protein